MKIKTKTKSKYCYRVKRKFVLIPRRINENEVAWLEFVYIVQTYNPSILFITPWENTDVLCKSIYTNKETYLNYKRFLKDHNAYPTHVLCFFEVTDGE